MDKITLRQPFVPMMDTGAIEFPLGPYAQSPLPSSDAAVDRLQSEVPATFRDGFMQAPFLQKQESTRLKLFARISVPPACAAPSDGPLTDFVNTDLWKIHTPKPAKPRLYGPKASTKTDSTDATVELNPEHDRIHQTLTMIDGLISQVRNAQREFKAFANSDKNSPEFIRSKGNLANNYLIVHEALIKINESINNIEKKFRDYPVILQSLKQSFYDKIQNILSFLPPEERGKVDEFVFEDWAFAQIGNCIERKHQSNVMGLGDVKREAAELLRKSNEQYRLLHSSRIQIERELNHLKQLLGNLLKTNPDELRSHADGLDRWLNQKRELETRISETQTALESIRAKYVNEYYEGFALYQMASFEEDALIHDMILEGLKARDAGEMEYYCSMLADADAALRFFIIRDHHILHQIINRITLDNNVTIEKSLWESIGNLTAKSFKEGIIRRDKLLRLSDVFSELRKLQPLQNCFSDHKMPGALPLEPYRPEELLEFENQVSSRGLTAIFVPDWNDRVVLPLDLEEALNEANGQGLYVLPGTGTESSVAFSSITPTLDISRNNKKWTQVPFIIDQPFHDKFAPRETQYGQLHPVVMNWHAGHLSQIKILANSTPNFFARSSGVLTAIELGRFKPQLIRCILGESPPAPTLDWQNHMGHFFRDLHNVSSDLLPQVSGKKTKLSVNLIGLAWFSGMTLAKDVARNVLDMDLNDQDFPFVEREASLRLQYTALESPLTDEEIAKIPPVFILYGEDDTLQYPDDEEHFKDKLEFPNLPLNQIWKEAEKRFPHIRAQGLLGGHLRFPVDMPTIRETSRHIGRLFFEKPELFDRRLRPEPLNITLPERLRRRIRKLEKMRKLKIFLHDLNIPRDSIVSLGRSIIDKNQSQLGEIDELWPKWDDASNQYTNNEFLTYIKFRDVI